MIPLREGRGRRERGEGEGGERYGKVKARNPKGWLTPHVPNPEKYPGMGRPCYHHHAFAMYYTSYNI